MPSGKKFSVVLPVRNGGEHVKQCVASVLAQTLSDDFELLILENASTDGTAEWLAALHDPRIRIFPTENALSIEQNWARILQIPRGEFMTLIGHDDLLDLNFLQTIARLIQSHPHASLYQTHFKLIDSSGNFLRSCQPIPAQESAAEFVAMRLCRLRDSFGTGHVMRSVDYDSIGGIPCFPKLLYADDALFVQAIGRSYRATALEEAFSYRLHPISASGACSLQESFKAFEEYAKFLQTLQRTDSALREVLHRYFARYAVHLGRAWLWEEHLLAYQQRRTVAAEIPMRFQAAITLFNPTYLPPPQKFALRLLEKAIQSPMHRFLFQTAYSVRQLQRHIRTSLRRRLNGKTAEEPADYLA